MYNLTPKQKQILDYLRTYYSQEGYSPTMQEVATHFNKSIPTIQGYFNDLIRKGFIEKDPHKSRSILVKDLVEDSTESIVISGEISAGKGISIFEENGNFMNVPSNWITGSKEDYYILKVSGFSMYEDGILDGDHVLIKKQSYADNGETVVGIIHENFEDKVTLKKFYKDKNSIRLTPSNPNLEDIIVDKDKFEIRGKFIGLIRR